MANWTKESKEKILGKNHYAWLGNKVGYSALHSWIRRKLGNPKECVDCGTTNAKKYEWANISGKYKRTIKDFKRVCVKCHRRMDHLSQARGECINHSKLNKNKVIKIRKLYTSKKYSTIRLGKIYGVNTSSITRIIRRINWKHI